MYVLWHTYLCIWLYLVKAFPPAVSFFTLCPSYWCVLCASSVSLLPTGACVLWASFLFLLHTGVCCELLQSPCFLLVCVENSFLSLLHTGVRFELLSSPFSYWCLLSVFSLSPPKGGAVHQFSHLHTALCSPWPDTLPPLDMRVVTRNYVFPAPSLRHPGSKKVKIMVSLPLWRIVISNAIQIWGALDTPSSMCHEFWISCKYLIN